MWNEPTQEQLNLIPRLYGSEHISFQDKIIHLHLFIGGCDWFIAETDGVDICFGFCLLNGDLQNSEWGNVSLNELKAIKVGGWLEVDNDLYWEIRPASEVEVIRRAHNWTMPDQVSTRIETAA